MTDDATTPRPHCDPEFDITELEALSGVTRRTIRYYIQRELVAAPAGTGRGKHYDRGHLQRLIEVRTRQEAGESLDAIVALSADEPSLPWPALPPSAPPLPEAWLRLPLAPGLELHAQAGRLDPITLRRIAQVVRSLLNQPMDQPRQGAPNDDRPEEP